jgi:uroporphyrinogen-III synthase
VAAADAVVFTAPSTVAAFVALRDTDGVPLRFPPHVVCIGPSTAAAAREAGMTQAVEGWGASAKGLVAELVGHFGPAS